MQINIINNICIKAIKLHFFGRDQTLIKNKIFLFYSIYIKSYIRKLNINECSHLLAV